MTGRTNLRVALWILLFVSFLVTAAPSALAQLPGLDPTLRSGDRPDPRLEEGRQEKPKPKISAPAGPEATPDAPQQLGPRIGVLVKKIYIEGNTTFPEEEIAAIAAPFLNRKLYYEDLEQLRRNLTLLYVQNGYVNSGAVLPDQTVANGVVRYVIIEGGLSDVAVNGNRWLREGYYTRRIALAAKPPLNIGNLEQRLQLLQQNGLIQKLQAELKPGLQPGQSILDLTVAERSPFNFWAAFNNYQSPSVGAERGLLTLEHRSLTGNGDVAALTYGRSRGLDPLLDVSYRLPVTAWDTEFGLRYRKNDFDIVDEAFADLDIESESEIIEVKVRQPFGRTPSREFAVGLIGEWLHSRSELLGIPYSFSPGSIDGESTVAALRCFQEYLYRSRRQVVAAHSRFSLGVDACDATIHSDEPPDGQFFAWLGQFQWTRIFSPMDIQVIGRIDIQLADQALLALEQLPVGGRYSVRGYLENQMVRDNGVIASLETRIPLVQNASWADYLQVAPFFDYGQAWNHEITPDPRSIYSVGLGMRWALQLIEGPLPVSAQAEVYWGHQLVDIQTSSDTLQDKGFHVQLAFTSF